MSLIWMDFFIFLLWINFISFIISFSNLINMFIFCELFWIIFFISFSILSAYFNSIVFFLISIYIICIATGESSIGLAILILKSTVYGSINNQNILNVNSTKNFNSLKIGLLNSKKLTK